MNDPFFSRAGRCFGGARRMAYDTDQERLNYAFRLLYGRTPTVDEVKDARQFLIAPAGRSGTLPSHGPAKPRSLAALMRVLL